jgi:SAM-dependent methyltransferase
MVVPFEPRRFRSTVPYYARFRVGYPDALVRMGAEVCGLEPGTRVLDLGCGPGLLAIPFARFGAAVTAVDPEPDMIEATRAAAAAEPVNVDVRQGSSYDLPADAAPFRLVVIGRAFHWMDREATLRALDRLVEPEGALALFGDRYPETCENAWRDVLDAVSSRFGQDDSDHRRERRTPGYRGHESVLLDSPFPVLTRHSVVLRRALGIDDIVGRALSRSTTSRERLGHRAAEFEVALRDELGDLSPTGTFAEIVEVTALVAKPVRGIIGPPPGPSPEQPGTAAPRRR